MSQVAGRHHLVFMGVAGSGKSTAALAVQELLHWDFAEGDDFHPPANVEKMKSGRPLVDEDRIPWLKTLAAWIRDHDQAGRSTLMSCSALRRTYRDLLRTGAEGTFFVHLVGDKGMLLERMTSRDHFMPPTLLESQLDTLEELGADEPGLVVDASEPPERIAQRVVAELGLGHA